MTDKNGSRIILIIEVNWSTESANELSTANARWALQRKAGVAGALVVVEEGMTTGDVVAIGDVVITGDVKGGAPVEDPLAAWVVSVAGGLKINFQSKEFIRIYEINI